MLSMFKLDMEDTRGVLARGGEGAGGGGGSESSYHGTGSLGGRGCWDSRTLIRD